MKNKVFDILRFLAETGITAIGACYLGLALIWHLPFGEQIRDTCLVVSTLLGVFVGVSRRQYNANLDNSTAMIEEPEEEMEDEDTEDTPGEDE